MTPEREAQMREAFEATHKGFDLTRDSNAEYIHGSTSMLWNEWLACARALEPMVRDGERYRFLRDGGRDDCGDGPWSEAYAAIASTNGPEYIDTTVDTAMSAALEEEKNENQ